MKKLLINIRYFIAPVLIIASMIGVLVGGFYSWLGLILLGIGILQDTTMRVQTPRGFKPVLPTSMKMVILTEYRRYIMRLWTRCWAYLCYCKSHLRGAYSSTSMASL